MRGFLSNYFDLLFSFKLVLKTFLFATVLYVFIATCPWSSVSVCTVPVNQSLCYSTLELVMTLLLLLFLRCIYASEIAKQCWSESCKQCYRKCAIVTFSLWLRPTNSEATGKCVCSHLSVCQIRKITQKHVHGFGWNVACWQISRHGRTD